MDRRIRLLRLIGRRRAQQEPPGTSWDIAQRAQNKRAKQMPPPPESDKPQDFQPGRDQKEDGK